MRLRRVFTDPPRWLEPASLVLLGIVLFLRYPVHFVLSPPYLMDFEVYRSAAARVLQGAGALLYEPTTADSTRMVFKYAPLWAILWAPMGWVATHAGAVLWTSAEVAALLATVALCGRLCRRHGIAYHPLTAVFAVGLLVRPLAEEMGNGQANLLWGCLMVLAVSARHPWASAAAMAGAVLLKLPALLMLPYWFLAGRRRALGRVLLVSGIAAVAGAALLVPRNPGLLLARWWAALVQNGTAYAFEIGNQSLLALLGRFLTADGYGLNVLALPQAVLPWMALALIAAAVTTLSLTARREESSITTLDDAAILTVLMVIGSPSCWLATYTALLFPCFLALARIFHDLIRRRWDPLPLALLALVIGLSWLTHRQPWRLLRMGAWHGETYLFLVFMILPCLGLVLIGLLWRQRQKCQTLFPL